MTAYCENGNGFGSFHEKSWNYLQEHAARVEHELRRKIWSYCVKNYNAFLKYVEVDDPDWEEIKSALVWEHEKVLDPQIELWGIDLIDDGLDDTGFIVFDFYVGWDEEHGMSVIMHKERVLAAGGGGEFLNCGVGLISAIKYSQQFNFDEGDLRIDG